MHISGQMWCGKERGRESCCAQPNPLSDTADGLSRFINLFGAERVGTKPDFFLPSVAPILVLNNGAKSSVRRVARPRQ